MKQDNVLPNFDTPVHPATVHMQSLTLRVKNVENPGGRKRANGKPTEIHYQWYVLTREEFDYQTYAEPIVGATGREITLKEALCNKNCYSRWGVSGYHMYLSLIHI